MGMQSRHSGQENVRHRIVLYLLDGESGVGREGQRAGTDPDVELDDDQKRLVIVLGTRQEEVQERERLKQTNWFPRLLGCIAFLIRHVDEAHDGKEACIIARLVISTFESTP
jgi:hypothetical protein